jgi:hypothetical protein
MDSGSATVAERGGAGLLLSGVAVGKTPGEPAGSRVRVGSEIGHLVRPTQAARRERVVHRGSEVHLSKRAAGFLERLFPTASGERRSTRFGPAPVRTTRVVR